MNNTKKCSSKKHNDKDAICYCAECDKYMCNQCANYHSDLFENHQKYDINKENQNIFTGICKEEGHKMELEYFCINHNKLCCSSCITKIKGHGNGQHTDCKICYINEIKEDKKSKLNKNIKILEDYSKTIEISLNELKKIFEKMNQSKEELKTKVSKIFTKIRSALNEREDEIILEIDKKFDKLYFKEDLIKQGEKIPNEIKKSLEQGKIINDVNYKINKLNIFINDCINIENNINNIQTIKNSIEKHNSTNIIINFLPVEDNEINKFKNGIKSFGKISDYIEEYNKVKNEDIKNDKSSDSEEDKKSKKSRNSSSDDDQKSKRSKSSDSDDNKKSRRSRSSSLEEKISKNSSDSD